MSTITKSAESTIKTTFITESDSKKCKVTTFLVFGTPDDTFDWITQKKVLQMMEIQKKVGGKPFDFPLTKAYKGNLDEKKDPKNGKALHLKTEGDYTIVEIHTKAFDDDGWTLSHEHHIKSSLFNAYLLTIKNTQEVLLAEDEFQDVENFSMGLEKVS